jgi:hypothetical protein
MVFIGFFLSGAGLLPTPRSSSTAVDEDERPTWRASPRFFYIRRGAERDVGNGELSSAREGVSPPS